jgi:hypothetical protein
MADDIETEIEKIVSLMDDENYLSAINIVNQLKESHPGDFRVQYTWLVLASFMHNHKEVVRYGPAIKQFASDEVTRGKIEYIVASAAWSESDFTKACEGQIKSIVHFCEASKEEIYPDRQKNAGPKRLDRFPGIKDYALRLFSDLKKAGLKCSPFYGSLLGLIREGSIIDHDKDIDLICHIDDFEVVCNWFADQGYRNSGPTTYFNHRGFKHPKFGAQIDLNGYTNADNTSITGFSRFQGDPYGLIQQFDKLDFNSVEVNGVEVYMPTESEKVLEKLYGENWSVSDPDYVPFVMDNSVLDNLGARFYRFHHFIKAWHTGQYHKLPVVLERMLELYPSDHLLQHCKNSIDFEMIESQKK